MSNPLIPLLPVVLPLHLIHEELEIDGITSVVLGKEIEIDLVQSGDSWKPL